MSVELEDLSKEELIEEVRSQRQDLQIVQSRVDAISNQVQIIKRALTGSEDNLYELEGFGESRHLIGWIEEIETAVQANREDLQAPKDPEGQLTRDERVTVIRQYLVDRAKEQDVPVYGADYKEVQALFGGDIGDSWASTLMKYAAGTFTKDPEKDKEGFELAPTKPRRKVRVHADKITDGSFL